VEFLAASMTLDKSNTDKLAEFCAEARRLEIKVLPPSVLTSGADFEPASFEGRPAIRYALSAIKGVGEAQARALEAINQRGAGKAPFTDVTGFAARLDPQEINKRTLECLASAGAFDELDPNRASIFAGAEAILAFANRQKEERLAGQSALFGSENPGTILLPKSDSWPLAERLQREFESIGFFLSGHPLDAYAGILARLGVQRFAEFAAAVKQGASAGRLAATVLDRTERRTKSGAKIGIVQLSDRSGQYEAILFQEGLNQYRDLLEKGACVLLGFQASVEGEDVRMRVVSVEPLDLAASRIGKGLRITLRDEHPLPEIARRLSVQGDGEVSLVLITSDGEVEIKLPGKFSVSAQIAGALKSVRGIISVEHV
jgi:DNA polymerase-3 subunit alpha